MGTNIADWKEHWDHFNVDLYIRVLTVKQQNQQDMAIDNETFEHFRELKRKKEETENKTTLQEVIQFLIDNEQYGDDWKKHIDLLQKIKDKIKIEKND